MASVILKTTAPLECNINNKKVILRGFGLVDTIDNAVWNECKKNNAIKSMLENGYIIEGAQAKTDDVKQKVQDEQDEAQAKNENLDTSSKKGKKS